MVSNSIVVSQSQWEKKMSQNEEFRMLKGIQPGEVVCGCAHAEPGANILTSNLLDKPVRMGVNEGFALRVPQKRWREFKEGVGTR